MSYELRILENFIYSNKENLPKANSNMPSITLKDVRIEIVSEYQRLNNAFQDKIYGNESREDIIFYLDRYGRRLIYKILFFILWRLN